MLKFISAYFRSLAFWVVVAVFVISVALGVSYDAIFGAAYPTPNWYYFSDLTVGDWITVIVGMAAILSVPVYGSIKGIVKTRK